LRIIGAVHGRKFVTIVETKLIEAGNALARSIGHRMGYNCPKISPAVPCTCGAGLQQAKALSDWDHLVRSIKEFYLLDP
jgi:hypothetical protein